MKRRSVVVHGHFYQPPREDPWTGRVPRQPSAAPYHDWNERIHDECYRAVVAARILDGSGRISRIVNTLEWMSWDAGPTLLEWMAREAPDTYRAFLEADARSAERSGHGNALATPYHHVILPLASRREKVTEVRWGVADFRRRFGRDPEGMWLPEAAVDSETLEVLAQEEIRFTVLGPTQVVEPPLAGLPGRVRLPGGRSIAVFVYDGPLSHDVAFGALLKDSSRWVERLAEDPNGSALVSMATDGETFGHHHRWGDMALAAMLVGAGPDPGLRLDSFGSFLASHPPQQDIEIVEPSSWSCVHGVDRWRRECGCRTEPNRPTSQAWREVLRDALADVADPIHRRFGEEGGSLFHDAWAARDAYGAMQGASSTELAAFLREHEREPLDAEDAHRALELLDMERDVLCMDTSCGWFFDDVARLEPLQNLLYAAHALDLYGEGSAGLEERLVSRLAEARSNDPEEGDAAQIWRRKVRGAPHTPEPVRAGEPSRTEGTVVRALTSPSAEAVDSALEALRAAPDRETFGLAGMVAREVSRRGGAGPHLGRLAEALGVAREQTAPGLPSGGPLRLVFGLHLHQPVGNFDEVFRSHTEDVYLPLIRRCAARGFAPMALHVSGPLLEWLEGAGHECLDVVARLVDDGALEPLLAGFYEPVLPVLSREDRLEQIGWMRSWIAERFGVDARGLWLTERVWEPGLARDLGEAGVEHVLLDDRHFLVAGFERWQLDRPWRTEAEGHVISVLPIDERLRYLVPFRSPTEIGAYLRGLSADGHAAVVLADDGEKFGGWPGTREWVWEGGWMEAFLDEAERLAEEGVIRLETPSTLVDEVPAGGLAYLPSASYREMELWSLPPAAAETFERIAEELADDPGAQTILRGGHWRNFLARYDEANRMHKKAQALSAMCRAAGNPPEARRAIGRAQCNDAYWHGVFGGLYLRHLRGAIWASLAEAEAILRAGERLEVDHGDVDADGAPEILIHSAVFSAVVCPYQGGAVVELTDFASRANLVDVLTRRRESYHRTATRAPAAPHAEDGSMPSIHEIEAGLSIGALPPVDLDPRALFVDRVVTHELDAPTYEAAAYVPLHSWARERFEVELESSGETVRISMRSTGTRQLEKTLVFGEDGSVEAAYRWDPAAFPKDARFAPELSVSADPGISFDPAPDEVWRHDVVTLSKRESGFEESVQGESITPVWPCGVGGVRVRIPGVRS